MLGKAVARGSKRAVIDEVFKNKDMRKLLIDKLGRITRAELVTMCSERVNSVLRQTSNDVYMTIDFDKVDRKLKLFTCSIKIFRYL